MKIKLNKILLSIMSIVGISTGVMVTLASGITGDIDIETMNNNTRAAAPASDTIYALNRNSTNGTMDYIKSSSGSLFFPRKKSKALGIDAYCMNHNKSSPNYNTGNPYDKSSESNKAMLYLMEVNTGLDDKKEYYCRQAVILNMLGYSTWIQNASRGDSGCRSAVKTLYNAAKGGSYKTTQDVTTSLSPSTIEIAQSGSNFESNWITVNVSQPSGLDYSAKLNSTTISLTGAPSSAQIIKPDGSVASGGNIGTNNKFKIRFPVSSVSGTITVYASATSSFEVGIPTVYNPRSSGLQPMLLRSTANKNVVSPRIGSKAITGGGNLTVTAKGSDGKLLANASFQVRNGSSGVTGTQATNSSGVTTFSNIPAGTYTLVETSVPSGYLNPGNQSVTIKSGQTTNITVTNQRATGNFKVIKKDDSGNALSGANFQLKSGSTVVAGTSTTNSSGVITFTNIPTGSYTLVETSAPTGYIIDSAQNNKTVQIEYGKTNEQTITNKRIKGNIKVTVLDSVDTRYKLSGAQIKLYNSSGSVVSTATTDSSGVATFNNIQYGTYTVKQTGAPTGYFLNNSTTLSFNITSNGTTYTGTIYNDRIRDFSMPGYNVKDSSGNIVGTLKKNTSYKCNVKIVNKYLNLNLPSDAVLSTPNIDTLKYKVAVNDGTVNQSASSITYSNLKGTVITSDSKTNIPIKDLSTIWETISFKIPNDETYSEAVIVIEITGSKDGNSDNNKLVVKLPILNEKTDKITLDKMEVYPSTSSDTIVGNDVNVKLDVSANSLKTYEASSKITVTGPSGFGTKTYSKTVYGVSLENPGTVYYKFKPTVAGSYTITSEAQIPTGKTNTISKTITVVNPSEPKTYLSATNRTQSIYDTNSYIKTYVKVQKRDRDKVGVNYCSSSCQEDTNGSKTCPGHKAWVWNSWYDTFILRKNTRITDIEENFGIVGIKFRSKTTEANAKKYSSYISNDGYVDMLNTNSAKYAQVKAGYGFDIQVETEYSNNLPQVFSNAYANNTVPGDTTWSQYKTIDYSGNKIPFIYSDVYGGNGSSVDSQVASYSGVVSLTVPSISDLLIENPNQIYFKLPDPSNEYYIADEGYKTSYSDSNIKQNLVMKSSTGVKLTSSKYSENKIFELKKSGTNKRGYYISKNVPDGVKTLTFYNRYAGYGLNSSTRLHDKKAVNIKVYGGYYDDIREIE